MCHKDKTYVLQINIWKYFLTSDYPNQAHVLFVQLFAGLLFPQMQVVCFPSILMLVHLLYVRYIYARYDFVYICSGRTRYTTDTGWMDGLNIR
jgi:hypothetical protein